MLFKWIVDEKYETTNDFFVEFLCGEQIQKLYNVHSYGQAEQLGETIAYRTQCLIFGNQFPKFEFPHIHTPYFHNGPEETLFTVAG